MAAVKTAVRGEVIGIVSGESRSDSFVFTADPENAPPLFDYVYFEVEDIPPGEAQRYALKVVAQIHSVKRIAPGITPEHPWSVLRNVSLPSSADTVVVKARVLGYNWKGRVFLPRSAPPVGTPVRYAPRELLEKLYFVEPRRRLHIGTLISRPGLDAFLDIEGVKRHIAVIAATGAGKTWASIILIEELLKKGATILVLDPHGEYVAMKKTSCRLGPEYCDSIRVVRLKDDQEGDLKYTISIDTMPPEELASVAGVPPKASRIRGLIGGAKNLATSLREIVGGGWRGLEGVIKAIAASITAADRARLKGSGFESFTRELARILAAKTGDRGIQQALAEKLSRENTALAESARRIWLSLRKDTEPGYDALRYLEELKRLGVYGSQTAPLYSLLSPGTATIVNLSGLKTEVQDHVVYNILSRVFSSRISYIRGLGGESYSYPVLVVLEEAHRFAPPKHYRQTRSRDVITMIASEGRKFGVFLLAITQRPSRLDQDVLSQLQSQIILRIVNPRDQDAVRDASEQLSQDLLENLPGLNTGEAVVVGPLAPLPVMIRLRDRVLEYSGGDLEVSSLWARSIADLRLIEDYRRDLMAKLNSLIGGEYRDLVEAVSAMLGRSINAEEAEEALRLLAEKNVWATLDDLSGTLYGEVGEVDVKINLREGLYSCGACGEKVCRHVLAALYRAILDGIVKPEKTESQAEQPWWLGEYYTAT